MSDSGFVGAGEKVETTLARIAVHGGRYIKVSFPTDLNPDWGAAIQWARGDGGMKYFVARTPEALLAQVLDEDVSAMVFSDTPSTPMVIHCSVCSRPIELDGVFVHSRCAGSPPGMTVTALEEIADAYAALFAIGTSCAPGPSRGETQLRSWAGWLAAHETEGTK